ncbi:MAG: hypothetical protein WCJ33_10070, partial [Pseudomonadota bacterium]
YPYTCGIMSKDNKKNQKFACLYTEINEKGIKGLITFSKKAKILYFQVLTPIFPKVSICTYCIHSESGQPFIQYFLIKKTDIDSLDDKNTELDFPQFDSLNIHDILSTSDFTLSTICNMYNKPLQHKFRGYLDNGETNTLMLFYDVSDIRCQPINLDKYSDLFPVLMDEIINQEKMGSFPISQKVVDFFKNNLKFSVLKNTNNQVYETPTVVYTGCPKNKLDFISTFGVPINDNIISAFVGPSFYFTDYLNAKKQGEYSVRFAVFLKNMKVVLTNDVNDTDDKTIYESSITRDLLTTLDPKSDDWLFVKNTAGIADRDRKWQTVYDSIYIGNNSLLGNGPLWVLKSYVDQIPLSANC